MCCYLSRYHCPLSLLIFLPAWLWLRILQIVFIVSGFCLGNLDKILIKSSQNGLIKLFIFQICSLGVYLVVVFFKIFPFCEFYQLLSVDQAIYNKFLGYSLLLLEEPSSCHQYAVCRIKQPFLTCLGCQHLPASHCSLFL